MEIKKRASPYLKQTEKELEMYGKIVGITLEQAQRIIQIFFLTLREFLSDERMPTIMLPGFGKIRPTLGAISKTFRLSLRYYKEKKIPKQILDWRLKRLWPVRLRLIYEKSGKNTYKHWSKVPSNWYKTELKELYEYYNWYNYRGGKELWNIEQGFMKKEDLGKKFVENNKIDHDGTLSYRYGGGGKQVIRGETDKQD